MRTTRTTRTRRAFITVCTAIVCAALWIVVAQAATPVLIAIGTISPAYEDFATETKAPLENGVPGNRLGGTGSGLAYIGGDFFLSNPDRGPNAVEYNPCMNNTTTYIPRFHTLHLSLSLSDPGAPLPFTLTPMVVDTTLLYSRSKLFYGAGCGSVGDGEPALNSAFTHYFSGRSDNFDPGVAFSTNPWNARFDPESVRMSNDGRSIYMSDEYGPYVYEFDRETGRRTRIYTLPKKFAVPVQGADEVIEFGNLVGRVANKGMEGLAITPDGRTLVGAMQSPLIQDGGDVKGGIVRIVTIDIKTGWTREYAYQLDADPAFKKTTLSEIVAINSTDFLVDERDGRGLGDNSDAQFKRIYRISLKGAADVSNIEGAANLASKVVPKVLFLDVVQVLVANGWNVNDIPAKLEGIAFGQDVTMGGALKHTLYVSNDNDFLSTVPNSKGTTTMNPNRFFVFAFSDADLPGFVQQKFDGEEDHDHDGHGPGRFPFFWPKRR
jgi:hypothetical protein